MTEPKIYKPSIYNGPTVYNNGGGANIPHVPTDTYNKLLYIRNKGNGWVKIPYAMVGMGVDFVFALNNYSSGSGSIALIANRGDTNEIVTISNNKEVGFNNCTYSVFTDILNIPIYEIVSIRTRLNSGRTLSGIVEWGANSVSKSVSADTSNNGQYIVIMHESDNPFASSKRIDFYSANIYNKFNELQLSLVPVKRISDGILGVYDLLSNNFYAFEAQYDLEAGPQIS